MTANQLVLEEEEKIKSKEGLKEAKAIGMSLEEFRKLKHDTEVVYQQLEIEKKFA